MSSFQSIPFYAWNKPICAGSLISTTSLRFYYKFNNNVNDSSGNGYNATATNLDYGTGRNSDFLQTASIRLAPDSSATGSNIYMENSTFTMSAAGVPFTISAWVKLRSYNNANTGRAVCGKYQTGSPSGGFDFRFWSYTGPVHTLQFFVANSDNAVGNRDALATYTFSTSQLATGVWHHLAGVYDGTRTYIYHNGICTATSSGNTCTAILNTTRRLTVGYSDIPAAGVPPTPSRFLDGEIDDLALFWRQLSQTEIQAIANSQCPLIT